VASRDCRTTENPIRIRLADIDAPEMNAPGGPEARQYASQILSAKAVTLNPGDFGGGDQYRQRVAVVYLQKACSIVENANRMMVDSVHTCVWDFSDRS